MTATPRSTRTSRLVWQIVAKFAKIQRAYSKGDWERALEKLEQGLCEEFPTADSTMADHSQIEDILPFYVSEEQFGSDVRRIYPLVWEHLRDCPECKEIYTVLAAKAPPPPKKRP